MFIWKRPLIELHNLRIRNHSLQPRILTSHSFINEFFLSEVDLMVFYNLKISCMHLQRRPMPYILYIRVGTLPSFSSIATPYLLQGLFTGFTQLTVTPKTSDSTMHQFAVKQRNSTEIIVIYLQRPFFYIYTELSNVDKESVEILVKDIYIQEERRKEERDETPFYLINK